MQYVVICVLVFIHMKVASYENVATNYIRFCTRRHYHQFELLPKVHYHTLFLLFILNITAESSLAVYISDMMQLYTI